MLCPTLLDEQTKWPTRGRVRLAQAWGRTPSSTWTSSHVWTWRTSPRFALPSLLAELRSERLST